ncbi:MAG: PEGA domain-containing protein [Pseudomonadota bacterium]
MSCPACLGSTLPLAHRAPVRFRLFRLGIITAFAVVSTLMTGSSPSLAQPCLTCRTDACSGSTWLPPCDTTASGGAKHKRGSAARPKNPGQPKGSILIESDVRDAEVLVDGKPHSDTTPTIVDGLAAGDHIVEVRKPPAPPWKEVVKVVAGASTKVRAVLAPPGSAAGGKLPERESETASSGGEDRADHSGKPGSGGQATPPAPSTSPPTGAEPTKRSTATRELAAPPHRTSTADSPGASQATRTESESIGLLPQQTTNISAEQSLNKSSRRRTLFWLSLGTGVLALATGATATTLASLDYIESIDHCGSSACDAIGNELQDNANRKFLLAGVSFVVTAVAAVGTVVFLPKPKTYSSKLPAPRRADRSATTTLRLVPTLNVGFSGLVLTGGF